MENVPEANASNWAEEVSKHTALTVVYFWHDQCPWCLRFNPIFSEITEEFGGRIRFFKINVLENPANQDMASNFGIMSTPTLLFLRARAKMAKMGLNSVSGFLKG